MDLHPILLLWRMMLMVIHITNVPLTHRFVYISQHNINTHSLFQQACEQLNAWIGGFQPVLNRMTPNNFNWFLHSLLFIHTQRVIKAQQDKAKKSEDEDDDDDNGGGGGDDDDDETDTKGVNIDEDE